MTFVVNTIDYTLNNHVMSNPGFTSQGGGMYPLEIEAHFIRFRVALYLFLDVLGTRGSHTMVVVLDQASMGNLKTPVVVQEYSNHGGKLFKVLMVIKGRYTLSFY